jgi:hypothetical protein
VLRRARPADAEALVEFNTAIHVHHDSGDPDEWVTSWVRDLLSGNHPTFKIGDFTVVEDAATGKIVSSLNLISQVWQYEGVRFKMGRPELVGTRPEYRRRGLVREQFEVIHGWGAQRGELVQAITGIPHYYRQFGYEMALEADCGRAGHRSRIPHLKKTEREPYRMRAPTQADVPFLARTYGYGMKRYAVSCARNQALWRYELRKGDMGRELRVIETPNGKPEGILVHSTRLYHSNLWSGPYELKPGGNWLAVTPAVVRYLCRMGSERAARDKTEFEWFGFWLGSDHPVYQVMPDYLTRTVGPYAMYVRVPDVPGFVRRISPALERRLSESVCRGYSGELKLSFYRSGIRMVFARGKLTGVAGIGDDLGGASASFPGLVFLQLLFGHRSLEELQQAHPDCGVHGNDAKVLLGTLFPKKASLVWPID